MALTIGVLVLASLQQIMASVTRLEDSVSRMSREDRIARRLLDSLAREFISLLYPSDTIPLLTRNFGDRDEVTWWTSAEETPKRVTYRWEGDRLVRISRTSPSLSPPVVDVIPDVTGLGLRYYGKEGWSAEWKKDQPPRGLAIELRIGRKHYGTIVTR